MKAGTADELLQLEQADKRLIEARATDTTAFQELTKYRREHPPRRRPFEMNGAVYVPVNVREDEPAELRKLNRRKSETAREFQDAQVFRAGLRKSLGLVR